MATRASVCSALLKRFGSKDNFLLLLVTVDETWFHYYEPENKAQSRQWVGPGSPKPKKFKTQPSAGKVMAIVFWDAKGVIMLDLLPQGIITGVYYANFQDHLRAPICKKRRRCFAATGQRESSHLQSCNGCCRANGYELIPHPAYSPDLAPSDFFLFPNLKKGYPWLSFPV